MSEKFTPHETVVLMSDQHEHGLRSGDVGAIVHVYEKVDVCDVEFTKADGRPVAILTLPVAAIRKLTTDDMLHVRHV